MLFTWLNNPQKLPLPLWDLNPSNAWFLGPMQVSPPNGILIGSAIFAQLSHVPNIQTDTETMLRATPVAIGHIYAMHAI